ncbi:MAG: hypothetical protein RL767_452 [Bacteroidota bacterium]
MATSSNGVGGPVEGVDDDAAMIMEDSDDLLLLDYRNILKIAITCGAFAIVVSALTLAFMMAMSRRLVYVALVLSIGVSFAWGTIGIGISPKSFVPITGIITLMLTVGYMFVVWDRIPFASANLTTALTGVRDNLSLVGVAFLFKSGHIPGSKYVGQASKTEGIENLKKAGTERIVTSSQATPAMAECFPCTQGRSCKRQAFASDLVEGLRASCGERAEEASME